MQRYPPPPPRPPLPRTHLSDVINRSDGGKREHAEAPAGEEAHNHAAHQQQNIAEQRPQHVGAGRNLDRKRVKSVSARLDAAYTACRNSYRKESATEPCG